MNYGFFFGGGGTRPPWGPPCGNLGQFSSNILDVNPPQSTMVERRNASKGRWGLGNATRRARARRVKGALGA